MSIDLVTHELYKANHGELERPEFDAVRNYNRSEEDYKQAFRYISDAVRNIGLMDIPNHSDVETASKLIGALGSRVPRAVGSNDPHALWLLTESFLLQGKDPSPVYAAILKKIMGGR